MARRSSAVLHYSYLGRSKNTTLWREARNNCRVKRHGQNHRIKVHPKEPVEGRINPRGVTYGLGPAVPDPSLADISLPCSCTARSKDGDSILGRLTEMPPFPQGYHRSVARKEKGCRQRASAMEMIPVRHPGPKQRLPNPSVTPVPPPRSTRLAPLCERASGGCFIRAGLGFGIFLSPGTMIACGGRGI